MNIITTLDAARILDVSAETVRNFERRGLLPATKTPRGIRVFDRFVVERFAHERQRQKKNGSVAGNK